MWDLYTADLPNKLKFIKYIECSDTHSVIVAQHFSQYVLNGSAEAGDSAMFVVLGLFAQTV